MTARKSNFYFAFLAVLFVLAIFMFLHAAYRNERAAGMLSEQRALLRRLPLTDLCLFTEASYTRHLSQADRHTAFQSSPVALEHFPSGSIHLPPESLRRIQ
jgi:predicted glycosyltransferase involved in capsule biosynthesis